MIACSINIKYKAKGNDLVVCAASKSRRSLHLSATISVIFEIELIQGANSEAMRGRLTSTQKELDCKLTRDCFLPGCTYQSTFLTRRTYPPNPQTDELTRLVVLYEVSLCIIDKQQFRTLRMTPFPCSSKHDITTLWEPTDSLEICNWKWTRMVPIEVDKRIFRTSYSQRAIHKDREALKRKISATGQHHLHTDLQPHFLHRTTGKPRDVDRLGGFFQGV